MISHTMKFPYGTVIALVRFLDELTEELEEEPFDTL